MSPSASSDPVLKRFRRKFVLVTMAFVAVLLIGVLVVASYMTATQRVADVRNALDVRSDRMHQLPIELMLADIHTLHEYGIDMDAEFFYDDGSGVPRGRGEPRNAGDDPFVATSAYLLDENGDIQLTVSNALGLDSDTVEEAIDDIRSHLKLDEENSEFGGISTLKLYYQLRDYRDGYTVVLASRNYVDRAMYSLISTLGIVEVLAFVLFLALSIFLSRWVAGPVERAWEQQRQFIADASHELKTPLSVIRANDSLLMADPSASVGSQMQWIESTEAEANLMQDLVNDMLTLAQSENMDSELVNSPVSLTEIVQGAELQFESVAFERGVVLDADIEEGVQVLGEAKSLGRLVGTLIDNACKYAKDGGNVDVHLRKQGGQCMLEVHNTGDPIPAEDLDHVFDRFYRSDKARTREQGGFGLGLAIAKNIVEEHRGSISVASNATDGTTFTVTLPLG